MIGESYFSRQSRLAACRGAVYRLLALGFLPPTPEMMTEILDGTYRANLATCLKEISDDSKIIDESLALLRGIESELAEQNPDACLEELAAEYARLFIGPGASAVPPYESAYNGSSGEKEKYLLMVSPTATEIEKIYRDAGVTVSGQLNEPPDHIATELEFMFYLSQREADAWVKGDNSLAKTFQGRSKAFLNEHLGQWGKLFCRKIGVESTHDFYKAIAVALSSLFLISLPAV